MADSSHMGGQINVRLQGVPEWRTFAQAFNCTFAQSEPKQYTCKHAVERPNRCHAAETSPSTLEERTNHLRLCAVSSVVKVFVTPAVW